MSRSPAVAAAGVKTTAVLRPHRPLPRRYYSHGMARSTPTAAAVPALPPPSACCCRAPPPLPPPARHLGSLLAAAVVARASLPSDGVVKWADAARHHRRHRQCWGTWYEAIVVKRMFLVVRYRLEAVPPPPPPVAEAVVVAAAARVVAGGRQKSPPCRLSHPHAHSPEPTSAAGSTARMLLSGGRVAAARTPGFGSSAAAD